MIHGPAVLLLIACATPEKRAAQAYTAGLEPLLDENALVAEQLGFLAASVYQESKTAAEIRASWKRDVVPLAHHLRDQAGSATVPAGWAETHAGLVAIWGIRAEAYSDLADAIDAADEHMWTAASQRAYEAKVAEERWFISADERLAPFGLSVPQFPGRPRAPTRGSTAPP